jgi:uncharacterized membrane protein YesL
VKEEDFPLKNKIKNVLSPLTPYSLDGKGVSKNNNMKESGIGRFFVSYKDNFNKILYVNILMVLGNLPLFFIIAVLSGYTREGVFLPSADLYQTLGGVFSIEGVSPFQMSLYALEGLPNKVLMNTTLTYVFMGIGALTIFTFGIVNVGSAYVLRNIAKGEPVFVFSDFVYAIKRNYKQAIPFGIIDVLIHAVLVFNLFTTISSGNFFTSLMFWGNVALAILFFLMRSYIYIQMVTFDLSVFKMVKNALSFVLIGLGRNLVALIGCALLIVFEIIFIFGAGGILISLGIALPLAIMFSTMEYMKTFAAYFKIKEIMIDPYVKAHPEEFAEETDEEVIMQDDVTYREKLEEIKRKNNID